MEASDMVKHPVVWTLIPGPTGNLFEHCRLYRIRSTRLRQSQKSHHLPFARRNILRTLAHSVSNFLRTPAAAFFHRNDHHLYAYGLHRKHVTDQGETRSGCPPTPASSAVTRSIDKCQTALSGLYNHWCPNADLCLRNGLSSFLASRLSVFELMDELWQCRRQRCCCESRSVPRGRLSGAVNLLFNSRLDAPRHVIHGSYKTPIACATTTTRLQTDEKSIPFWRHAHQYIHDVALPFELCVSKYISHAIRECPVLVYSYVPYWDGLISALGFAAGLVLYDETRKFFVRRYPKGFLARIAW